MSNRNHLLLHFLLNVVYVWWWFTTLLNLILTVIDLLGYNIPIEALLYSFLISIYSFTVYQMLKERYDE
ncbi:hypothetical protein DRO45_00200 [Candidatus Bathyarchaeota archaeon]|nr:MAG: hypothetical protein DRO45_00200 [Candidatus Bathyarchaeota archaeon]